MQRTTIHKTLPINILHPNTHLDRAIICVTSSKTYLTSVFPRTGAGVCRCSLVMAASSSINGVVAAALPENGSRNRPSDRNLSGGGGSPEANSTERIQCHGESISCALPKLLPCAMPAFGHPDPERPPWLLCMPSRAYGSGSNSTCGAGKLASGFPSGHRYARSGVPHRDLPRGLGRDTTRTSQTLQSNKIGAAPSWDSPAATCRQARTSA